MMFAAHVPTILWHRAVAIAAYLLNRLPTSGLPENEIPYEALHQMKPPTEILHPFGCDVYVVVQEHLRAAFDATARVCYYLGPVTGTRDMFHYFNPVTNKLDIGRDGIFKDDLQWTKTRPNIRLEDLDTVFGDIPPAVVIDQPVPQPIPAMEPNTADRLAAQNAVNIIQDMADNMPAEIPEPRQQRPPTWLRDYAYNSVLSKSEGVDDLASVINRDGQRTFTLVEVKSREDCPLFQEVMSVELNAMKKNEKWENAELPDDRKPVGYVWTFTILLCVSKMRTLQDIRLVCGHKGLPKCMAWIILRLSHR